MWEMELRFYMDVLVLITYNNCSNCYYYYSIIGKWTIENFGILALAHMLVYLEAL